MISKSKILTLLVACLSFSEALQKEKEKAHEMSKMLLRDCMTKEGASEDDLAVFATHKLPESPTGKCILACAFQSLDVVSSN